MNDDEFDDLDLDDFDNGAADVRSSSSSIPSSATPSAKQRKDAVDALTRAWRNEKISPEILPFEDLAVSVLEVAVNGRTEQLQRGGKATWTLQMQSWYQQDCDRIKYLLNSYRRSRIFKIQKWFLHLAASEEARKALSKGEKEYLESYKKLRINHLKATVLSHLPSRYRTLGSDSLVSGTSSSSSSSSSSTKASGQDQEDQNADKLLAQGPSQHKFVIIRVIDDIGSIQLRGMDDEVTLQKGFSYIITYGAIADLLKDKRVELI